MFFVISWVFYDINIDYEHDSSKLLNWVNAFSSLGQIWIYQFIFTIGLFVVVGGTSLYIFIWFMNIHSTIRNYGQNNNNTIFSAVCGSFFRWIFLCMVYAMAMFILPIILEIVNYIFPALVLYIVIDDKLPS